MKHLFQTGTDPNAPVLLLLHGTGGNEHDLLPLAQLLSPSSSVLSVRGSVLENGMPRFFRRLAEGIFDEEDLKFRTKELYDFIAEASETYGFSRDNVVAAGYSNGANIAGSLLFHYANALRGAVLHHPMVPLRGLALPDMTNVPIFIGAGTNDPICSATESEELASLLQGAGASVTVHWEGNGHRLSSTEVQRAAEWFKAAFPS
ncbi:carboxylesterase [Paenibacillus glycanilyticus]|uniref:Carboxylesterase n=1 Tax=Paenibacillus glycanilyticus TaxID=126569 RepID=A0ABQ6NQ29_9BACL|nr:alpha/beta hydrolase [Paenibacillus glycanilyticus]GMK47176.1 carboxylesterase [Paenibacillus glycanilyticus]